jgi:hypothetical protein
VVKFKVATINHAVVIGPIPGMLSSARVADAQAESERKRYSISSWSASICSVKKAMRSITRHHRRLRRHLPGGRATDCAKRFHNHMEPLAQGVYSGGGVQDGSLGPNSIRAAINGIGLGEVSFELSDGSPRFDHTDDKPRGDTYHIFL